ncbi:MAG TPA: hypothetical protein VKI65_14810 [Gemmataceae bacterium]|nr:hypothetical protein [Gemmataceae bacterium]
MTSASDPDSTYAFGYDNANRLTTVNNSGTPGIPNVILGSLMRGAGTMVSWSLGTPYHIGADLQ